MKSVYTVVESKEEKKRRRATPRVAYPDRRDTAALTYKSFQPTFASDRIEDKAAAAEKALVLMYEVMMGEGVRLELRLSAAREILDRVWGRPAQGINLTGLVGVMTPEQLESERKRRWSSILGVLDVLSDQPDMPLLTPASVSEGVNDASSS